MRRSLGAYLWDILGNSERARRFVGDKSREEFVADELVLAATARQLEIIGEAMNQAEKSYPGALDQLPGVKAAIGMRNRLTHGYFAVNADIVFDVVRNELPRLEAAVRAIMPEAPDVG
jgi:uncharacterized protein with HEPN domain